MGPVVPVVQSSQANPAKRKLHYEMTRLNPILLVVSSNQGNVKQRKHINLTLTLSHYFPFYLLYGCTAILANETVNTPNLSIF